MAEVEVKGLNSENATLLLAAAEELGLPAHVVRTDGHGGSFFVPEEVANKADLGDESAKANKSTAKKATAKKATAKDKE
jgi:hypothetical protein